MEKLPELLAPAGTPEALSAAVAAGADAVYFGAPSFNARMGARNFGIDEIREAAAMCHAHGVRVHIALNTEIYDRELDEALRLVEAIYNTDVDALIVADLGLARLCRSYFPDLPLHASTQCSGHSARDAEYLSGIGFSRMVCARELSAENIGLLVKRSPIEIEMFVHGAICVSLSGQCLYSSLVGGRSGNRGECAQPCRLPYKTAKGTGYPLSTKDLCLAGHIREIISLGVSSLKIEGRMKSPGYVYTVTSLYRRLLDERRNADAGEADELAAAFSRSGFTDAYFTGAVKKRPNGMLGVRTEEDKERSRLASGKIPDPARVPIEALTATFAAGVPSRLSLTAAGRCVTVTGETPDAARTRPLSREAVVSQLCRFGNTPFTVTDETRLEVNVADGVIMPVSAINELRRRATSALTSGDRRHCLPKDPVPKREPLPKAAEAPLRTAEFADPRNIGLRERDFFDMIYLPLTAYDGEADGFVMPAAVYDGDEALCRRRIEDAVKGGARFCILSGAGQHKLIEGLGLRVTAGLRYNICNTESAIAARDAGAELVTVSPEATSRQARGIAERVPASVVVYGRLPLMVTERCLIRAVFGDECRCKNGAVTLTDRRGVAFPMMKTDGCGTVIYNSVPTYMADRREETDGMRCRAHHFIFTTENKKEVGDVVDAYRNGAPASFPVRRIK